MKTILLSGGFDPLHYGHLKMISEASRYGKVIVAVNSNEWLLRKKGFIFFDIKERINILKKIEGVERVVEFNDDDGTCIDALIKCKPTIFANGGDRNEKNTPEKQYCIKNNIECLYGIGGENKENSSSEIAKRKLVKRSWGEYESIYRDKNTNIKRLYINKGKGVSLQRHFKRSETWIIEKGEILVEVNEEKNILKEDQDIKIKTKEWHKCIALKDSIVLEIQKGTEIKESDIERRID